MTKNTMQHRRGPSLTRQQSLVDYLALGAERSLRRLARHYDEIRTENPPSFATLALWSRRDQWQAAAAAHDEYVGAALVARLRATAVQDQFDRVTALTKLAQACLDTANEIELHAEMLSVSDIRALVTAAIDAIKMVEVLTGGVSDRAASAGGVAEEALVLLRQLEAQKRGGALLVAPPPDEARERHSAR
jgi:hypothetical protein